MTAAKLRERLRRDDGMTLIELLVGMVVMSIFMTMVTTAVFSMNTSSQHTSFVAYSSTSVNTAFLTLDRADGLRYASAISKPSTTPNAANNYYAEYQSTNTGTTICSQLQLNTTTQLLKRRTWTVPSNGTYANLSGFQVLASNVVASGTPFTFTAYTASAAFEQLTLSLASTQGVSRQQATSTTSMTFTAVNSFAASAAAKASSTQPTTVCQEVGRP